MKKGYLLISETTINLQVLPRMSLIEVLCWLRDELPLTHRQAPKVGHAHTTEQNQLFVTNISILCCRFLSCTVSGR